jgi:hypothetical protein
MSVIGPGPSANRPPGMAIVIVATVMDEEVRLDELDSLPGQVLRS